MDNIILDGEHREQVLKVLKESSEIIKILRNSSKNGDHWLIDSVLNGIDTSIDIINGKL